MILRALARLFIAAALLVAQQSAFAHQIWHFAAAPAQQAAGSEPQDTESGGKPLCDLHTALGTVLGALGSADTAPQFTAPQADAVPAAAPAQAPAAPVSPSSRGPPTLH
jgi:hypothetical protein